jgi:tRNA (cytidine/uridine-2'-O-)-methyltransferase
MPPLDDPLLHLVLVEPEIPNNAGNIGRTCMATGCALHLVHPLGFDTDDKAVRRAGMDYWHALDVREHASWDAYASCAPLKGRRVWATSGKRGRPPWEVALHRGAHILLGRESAGLRDDALDACDDRVIRLPMLPGVRGLNVASSAAALIYEAMRQCATRGELTLEEGMLRARVEASPASGGWRGPR